MTTHLAESDDNTYRVVVWEALLVLYNIRMVEPREHLRSAVAMKERVRYFIFLFFYFFTLALTGAIRARKRPGG